MRAVSPSKAYMNLVLKWAWRIIITVASRKGGHAWAMHVKLGSKLGGGGGGRVDSRGSNTVYYKAHRSGANSA